MKQDPYVYELLQDLNSFQGEMMSKMSRQSRKQQQLVSRWFCTLPYVKKANICRIEASNPFVQEVFSSFQTLMISEPSRLERIDFSWHKCVKGTKIKLMSQSHQKNSSRVINDRVVSGYETEFISSLGVVWEGMKLVDVSFIPVPNLLELMQRISENQCFFAKPADNSDVGSISWLRRKSHFSLAQCLAALLELNIWHHWKNRSSSEDGFCGVPHHRAPDSFVSMHNALLKISMNCGSIGSFRTLIESRGRKCMKRLLTNTGDNRVSLYLTIMKKRLSRGWYDCCGLCHPIQYTPQIRSLWVLSHLVGLMDSHRFRRHVGGRSIASSPELSYDPDPLQLVIWHLITIPLFDSFSFIHELRSNIRDDMISDFAFSDLLNASNLAAESLSTPRNTRPRKSKKKRLKKLSGKSADRRFSSTNTREVQIEPSLVLDSNIECIAPSEVTEIVVESTKLRIFVANIIDEIINISVAASAESHQSARDHDNYLNVEELNISKRAFVGAPLLWTATRRDGSLVSGSGSLGTHEGGGNMDSSSSFSHLSDSRWMHGDIWNPSGARSPSTAFRFGGLFGESIITNKTTSTYASALYYSRNELGEESSSVGRDLTVIGPIREENGENGCDDSSHMVCDLLDRRSVKPVECKLSSLAVPVPESTHVNQKIFSQDDAVALPLPLATSGRQKRSHSHDFVSSSGKVEGRCGGDVPVDFHGERCFRKHISHTSESRRRDTWRGEDYLIATTTSLSSTPGSDCGRSQDFPLWPAGLSTEFNSGQPPYQAFHCGFPLGDSFSGSDKKEWGKYAHSGITLTDDDNSRSIEHETDYLDGISFDESSGLDEAESSLDGDGTHEEGSYYRHLPVHAYGTRIALSAGRGDQRLVLAMACACLKSQAESSSLRNLIALQRSVIALSGSGPAAPSGVVHIPSPYYSEPINGVYNYTQRRELEVMSDGGDFDFVSRHSRRQEIALGGAATLSSLYFRKPSHKTVDDAGVSSGHLQEFDRGRITASSRSFSESGRSLDRKLGGEIKDRPCAGSRGILDLPDIESVGKSALQRGFPPTCVARRGKRDDGNRDVDKLATTSVSDISFVSPPILNQDELPFHEDTSDPDVREAETTERDSASLNKDSSSLSIPIVHSFCTMSEYGGGIPSPLTIEICTFVAKIDRFDACWHSHKMAAIDKMSKAVQSLWPRAQVKAFGSFVSGLSLPSSDLDLVICLPKVHKEAGPEAAGFLEGRNAIKETWQQNLARCLSKETWVDVASIKVISNTAVPVIKFKTQSSNGYSVPLDVSFEGIVHQGLEANKLCVSLMNEFLCLRPIVLVLKQFLSRRGLCESYTGGLSSYALLLMTARFLQEQPPDSPLDIGAVLLGILDFFGNNLQPAVTGISVGRRCYFSRVDYHSTTTGHHSFSAQGGPLPPLEHTMAVSSVNAMNRRHSYNKQQFGSRAGIAGSHHSSYYPCKFDPLFIEDPLAHGNNVGRNCFRIHQIQRIWSDMHSLLLENINLIESGISGSTSLLFLLVGEFDSGST